MKKAVYRIIKSIRTLLSELFHAKDSRLPYIITVIVSLVIVVGGINLFIELTDTLKTDTLARYDTAVTDYIISFRNPSLTTFFKFVTDIGDVTGYLIVLMLFVLLSWRIIKSWKYVLQSVVVLVLATLSNMALKRFVDRARPGIEHLVTVKTLSYPSGHAMGAMAFFGFLIYLISKLRINRIFKYSLMVLVALLILSIGISRIYLGVHYPSDVAGGFIAGFIWVVFCILIFDVIQIFRRDPEI
ncbi:MULTISPECIES: phosphatase PAP2 family protein [Maribacter]|uniref:Phosphatase PAP2 family protein n=1 Tax=Maribacter flavus TaxID=1658664 RepID=A0ABU7IJY9_9FLAO|nr:MULTISPECIES: phosphatase PAP2 family protein [Maribacter]MDC6405938.1 phosphatase PAP2 family protein [Maribacter sp. PR66]MEE1973277.1 phosphatase PAP2 family protein [Maribacter flavus]